MSNNLRRFAVAGVLAAAALGLSACGGNADDGNLTSTAPATFDMHGSITLTDSDDLLATRAAPRYKCAGTNGYSGMGIGAQVVVYGPDGSMVAVGSVDDAVSHVKDEQLSLPGTADTNPLEVTLNRDTCELVFTVPGVPAGLGTYSYEVANRGKVAVTEDQAAAGVAATLG
jgi:hypothetical protein